MALIAGRTVDNPKLLRDVIEAGCTKVGMIPKPWPSHLTITLGRYPCFALNPAPYFTQIRTRYRSS